MNVKTARVEAFYALAALDYEGALKACRQGLYQSPDNVELHLITAHSHMRSGRFEEGVRAFEAAATCAPADSRLRCLLAIARDQAGDTQGALAEFREIVAADPLQVTARYHLASLLGSLGEFALAINEYQELVRQEPECVQAHNNLGVLLSAMGDPDGAIASFERARRANPGDAVSAVNLAREWAVKGELKRAEDAIAQALDVSAEFGEALALAGWIHLQQKRYVEAEGAYRAALASGFDTPETRAGHLAAARAVGA